MSDHYDRYNGMENLLGTNLAEVGTMTNAEAIDVIRDYLVNKVDNESMQKACQLAIKALYAEQKRETATVSVGASKSGVTMWYECAACGEPVDPGDTFCSGCGRELIHE